MKIFDTVQGRDIIDLGDGSYLWVAGAEIDGDGAGGNAEGDPDWQATTSLKHPDGSYLNLRMESVIVVPPAILYGVPGIVLGSKAQVTRLDTLVTIPAVVGEEGPADKIGELSIFSAEGLGVPSNPRTGGNPLPIFAYRFWPGIAAPGYQLQAA